MKKNFYSFLSAVLVLLIWHIHALAQPLQLRSRLPLHIYQGSKNKSSLKNNAPTTAYRTNSCITDSIVLTRQSQIDSFPLASGGCTVLRRLRIDGTDASPAITRLDSLKYITAVTEEFFVSHTSVSDLSVLTGITSLGYFFWMDHNGVMTNVVLPNLTQVGDIIFDSLPNLTSIAGLTSKTNHDIGTMIISGTGLRNLNGLENMYTIPNMYISVNPHLLSLQGLQNLTSCNGGLSIWGNDSLSDISALSHLTSITDGTLEVSYNYQLENLKGLGNITDIGYGLWINGNSLLTSLSDLNPDLVIENKYYDYNNHYDSVRIQDNQQLALCSFPPLCNYLTSSSAAYINDNAPGCNDIDEIKASCSICTGGNLKTWAGTVSTAWNDADNWIPAGVPANCDSVFIPSGLTNYPMLTSNVTIHGLDMRANTTLNLNSFSITDNGNLRLDTATLDNTGDIIINNPIDPHVEYCSINANITISGYKGTLDFNYNTVNFGHNVFLADNSARVGINNINGNNINGNFSLTANAVNNSAETEVSEYDDDFVNGNASFTVNAPVHFFVGDGSTFHVGGSLVVNSNLTGYPGIGNLEFSGGNGSDSHITQIGSNPISIDYLSTNKLPGYIVVDQNVYITQNVRFLFGVIKTAPDKLLVFNNNAGINQTSSASYVWGPVKKIGSQAFNFPLGDSIYRGTCGIFAPASSADEFTAQYFYRNPASNGYDTSKHVTGLGSISGKEYWTINHTTGNLAGRSNATAPNVRITLSYDSTHSGPLPSIYSLRVARWDGSTWQNEGNGGVTGNTSLAFVPSAAPVAGYGTFTLGITPTRIPVITVGNIDSVHCSNQLLRIPFSVDTLLFTNNQFIAQLSDSTGSFANPANIGYSNVGVNHSDTISAYNLPYNPSPTAIYKIRVIANSPLDTSINTKSVRIKTVPIVQFTIQGPNPGCINPGLTKYYTNLKEADTATNYAWEIYQGGTIVSTHADTAFVNWTSPGRAFLGVRTSNTCGSGQYNSVEISVSQPAPTVAPIVSNNGRWLSVSAPPAGQYTIGYKWYRDDILTDSSRSGSYYASLAGTYKVRYYTACGDGPVSNPISFTAASSPQTIHFPSIPNKTFGDSSFALPATSTSGLPVSYTIISGPGNIPGNIYNITGTGIVTIRATQPGDNVYDTAVYADQSFTVNKASQTINFPTVDDKEYNAEAFDLKVTSSSGLPVQDSILSGNATVNGRIVTLTGAGTVTIRAYQPGDTNYIAATSVSKSFCVKISSLQPISGPVTICPGIPATYSVNNIAGAVYSWRVVGGGVLSSTAGSVTTTWPSAGNYTLLVSAKGDCGAESKTDTLSITAITSVKPDSVQNMLPANGAANQQLPLTLSWIPKNPNLFYTYDVYLWRADSAQPATPYVTGLTSVNYTIPLYSGLSYNQSYKWMVVAHNGSCTVLTTGPVQQFSLIPLPDLQVYSVTAPVSAFSGQAISVTWKVKNNGPGNTQLNQQWTDAIFIAKDSTLDFTNPAGQLAFPVVPLLVATKPNVSSLNAGELYSDTATFTLPRDYSGPLFMHVVTNYAPPAVNPVIEVTKVNDTAHSAPPTSVALSPTPDLRVDTIINPNNTFSGSTINLQAKIRNYGVNAFGQWIDKVYLSKDPIFNLSNAILLKIPNGAGSYFPLANAEFVHTGPGLQQDSSYTANFPVVIPNFIYGNYYVYVFTNANADLYEGARQNNNTGHGNAIQIFLTPTPKLTPTFPYTVYNFSTTQQVIIGWQIQNQGAYDNIQKNQFPDGSAGSSWGYSEWDDKAYISGDSTGLNTSSAYYVGSFHERQIILPQGSYYGNVNWTVPDNFPTGTYYMYLQSNVNKSVFEYPGTQLTARSNAFSILRSDLTVPSVSIPATGSSGQTITVNYSVLNIGEGIVSNHYRKDYIYLGNNSTFDSTAQLIDSAVYNSASIPVKVAQPLQKQAGLPNGISGAKYIFVRTNADSSFKEDHLNNNINTAGAPINIALTPNPDLQVTSVKIAHTVYSSTGFPFKYTVSNIGTGVASGSWKDSIFISCSSSYSPASSYFVGVRSQQNYVLAGGSYSDSFNLVVPLTFLINNSGCLNNDTAQVYFFVKANADNMLYEAGLRSNNISGSSQTTVINTLVDHIVTNVSSSDSALVGRYFKVNWTVKNTGLNPNDNTYNGWNDAVYLSSDSVMNSNAHLINYKTIYQRLNHDHTYSDSLNGYIPNLATGYYYLFANTNAFNQIVAERNLTNNTNLRRNSSNQPVRVYVTNPPAADLVNTIVSAPANTAVGQPVQIIYKITNNGVGPTYPSTWTDDIWLSNSFQPGGLLLSRKYHSGTLAPGQSYIDTITATIPLSQPQGNYAIVLFTNQDHLIYESDFSNNTSYQYVSVYVPPPVDLVVDKINTTDTVILGYPATINWTLLNTSGNAANGTETDGMYISSDTTTNTTNDVLIGTKANTLNLLPLNSTDISARPVIAGVMEGNYSIKIKADILNNILETNKQNNTGVSNRKVYVKIKNLPVGLITPDSLTSNYLYYKLVVPTQLKGKTISLKLTSNDSVTANNQLYVSLGYLPSAARFDYAYSAPNAGNQQIIIESVSDSVYYIAAKGSKPGSTGQVVNLYAEVLPFAIVNVNSSSGGNTGNVTVMIKGTLFSNNMQASIAKSGNVIAATTVYFVNGTTAYATFNLQGATLGVYDVTLKKPDLSTATLPSGFRVVSANNGGLLTGSGTNGGQSGNGNTPGCDPGATSGLNAQLQTEIIYSPNVFANYPFIITINYTNASNVDIPAQVRILYSLSSAPLSITEGGLSEGKTNLYLEFKDSYGPANIIRAGGGGTIKIYSKAPLNAQGHSFINFNLQ